MMMRQSLFVLLFSSVLAMACNEAKFHGNTPSRATSSPDGNSTDPNNKTNSESGKEDPSAGGTGSGSDVAGTSTGTDNTANNGTGAGTGSGSTPGSETIETPCSASEHSIGAQLAFIIDNSSSNKTTDCKGDYTKIGSSKGLDIVECNNATNRENAVLATYDLLANVATQGNSNAESVSSVQVVSFPGPSVNPANGQGLKTKADYENYIGRGVRETNAWLDVTANQRNSIENAMLFSRKPFGTTPYAAGLTSANEVFASAAQDKRAKVAVLVSDGEPTDGYPNDAINQAQALRQAGVEVITVLITGNGSLSSRRAAHAKELSNLAETWKNQAIKWYDTSAYDSFDKYLLAVQGDANTPSLVEKVSSKVIEVKDASALRDTFLKIVKTQVIQCVP